MSQAPEKAEACPAAPSAPARRIQARRWLRRLGAVMVAIAAVSAPPFNGADEAAAERIDARAALDAVGAWVCGASDYLDTPLVTSDRFLASAADEVAPWMAKLEIVERAPAGGVTLSYCGGAVLTRDWIVTAAHCVGGGDWESVRVTLGAKDLRAIEAVRRSASVALCHRGYDADTLSHDVALLRLAEPLPANFPTVRIASQEESLELRPGDMALSAGWSRVGEAEISHEMRRTSVRVLDPDRGGDGVIVAAPDGDRASLCVGESGAPLVTDLGFGAAVFGVFSSVDAYLDPDSGDLVELCEGFEARSYFTAVKGLQSWMSGAIAACDADLEGCLARAPQLAAAVAGAATAFRLLDR